MTDLPTRAQVEAVAGTGRPISEEVARAKLVAAFEAEPMVTRAEFVEAIQHETSEHLDRKGAVADRDRWREIADNLARAMDRLHTGSGEASEGAHAALARYNEAKEGDRG